MPAGLTEDESVRLRATLSRAVASRCPGWLADQREDIVQDAMARVLAQTPKGEGDEPFRASYLWSAAYSALIDEIRRRQRRREVPLPEHEPPASAQPSPERHTAGREINTGLRQCLRRLVDDRRRAVTLHLQGHRVKEVAALLGWDDKRADNSIYRGLGDLRRCLTAKGLKP